jgi:hypothetical protein
MAKPTYEELAAALKTATENLSEILNLLTAMNGLNVSIPQAIANGDHEVVALVTMSEKAGKVADSAYFEAAEACNGLEESEVAHE